MIPPDSVSGPLTVSVPGVLMPLPGEKVRAGIQHGREAQASAAAKGPATEDGHRALTQAAVDEQRAVADGGGAGEIVRVVEGERAVAARFNVIAPASEPVPLKT